MLDSRSPVKETIVLAACECIESKGLQSLTTRDIAREAGVNIATIHYHFGTKQKLVELALERTISHGIEHLDEILQAGEQPAQERVTGILRFIMEGAVRFPNITRAHLYDVVIDGKKTGIFLRQFSAFLKRMLRDAGTDGGGDPSRSLELFMVLAVSSSLFLGMAPAFFGKALNVDFTRAEDRDAYMDFLSCLAPRPEGTRE
jgi:AcrR family transcriptional regulator